jgi:membrane-bound serine protease (ClpP class)
MKRSLVLVLCAVFSVCGCAASEGGDEAGQVHLARLDGEVNGRTAGYLTRVISEAEEARARAVVIEIDTPGGRLDATRTVVEAQSNARSLPVVAYVSPQGARAASAGTFIVMASDVAAMAPQTTIGAAAPVDLFGRDLPGILGEKVTNDASSLLTGLAEAHGRNVEWAEKAVQEAASANAAEALEIGVVEYVEPDLESVLEAADGERVEPKGIVVETSGAAIVSKSPTFGERFGIPLYAVVVPAVLAILAAAGFLLTVLRTSRSRIRTGREGMIGEIGVVRRAVEGTSGGTVFVHGELWSALPEIAGETLAPETEVEVVGFRRTALLVRRAGDPGSS